MALPNFPDMLHAIAKTLGPVSQLIAAMMFLAGIALVFRAMYALKQYGELRTMMSTNADLKAPLIYLLVGAVLMFYPTTIDVSLETIYSSTNITAYQQISSYSADTNQAIKDAAYILKIIGFIAFFRGWLLLTHLGSQSSPPGTLGKALAYIISGILLVNIFATWNIIKTTLGLGGS